MQQVTADQVFVAEHLLRTAMQEACAVDASVCAIPGRDGVLCRAVFAVDESGGTPQIIRCFGNEVSIAIYRKTRGKGYIPCVSGTLFRGYLIPF